MKKIISIIITLAAAFSFVSCDSMDSLFKEYVENGPIVYIGKVDSVKVQAGDKRVKISWIQQSDPRAKTATIYWYNKSAKQEVTLDANSDFETFIENLNEGSIVFQIITHDAHGNSSVPVEATGNVYGDTFRTYLSDASITAFSKSASGVATITIKPSSSAYYTGMEITYLDSSNATQTIVVPSTQTKVTIDSYTAASFSYRSVFTPEENAIDNFYSEPKEYETL